jgi:Ni,Fe-hydrogenase I cytochrome b subunit
MSAVHRLHPLAVRIMHWINAAAMIMMIMSGWLVGDRMQLDRLKRREFITLPGAVRTNYQCFAGH